MRIEPFETCDGCEALVCLDLGKCSKDAHRTLKISGWLNQSMVTITERTTDMTFTSPQIIPDDQSSP